MFGGSRGMVICVIFLILLVPAAAHGLNVHSNSEKIMKGRVYINDVLVGGMDVEQARNALEKKVAPFSNKEVVLSFNDRLWRFRCSQLGIEPDVETALREAERLGKKGPIITKLKEHWEVATDGKNIKVPIILKKEKALGELKRIGKEIEQKRRNAKYLYHSQRTEIVPHVNGRKLEYEKTLEKLLAVVRTEGLEKDSFEVELSVLEIPPKIRTEDIKGKSITTVAGEYTTYFNTALVGRSKNIVTAVKYLDGTVIPPGGTFSFNETVGPRTKEAGFEEALIIVGQEFTPGLGGGVCQVSSTLYNAALKAGMKITERSRHSRIINYVPIGLDAAVSYGILDLKFENTSDNMVVVCGEVWGGTLTMKILSESPNSHAIEIDPIIEHTVEPKTETRTDEEIEEGKEYIENMGKKGYVTKVERRWITGGKVFKREIISRDFYPAEKRVIVKGAQKKRVSEEKKKKVSKEQEKTDNPASMIFP